MSSSGIRYLVSVMGAVVMTLAAFFVMHTLVDGGKSSVERDEPLSAVRFASIEITAEIEPEPRHRKPERKEPEDLPPIPSPTMDPVVEVPEIEMPPVARGSMPGLTQIFDPRGPGRSGGGEAACRTRVAPLYPREQAMRGIEGEVTVAFTITTAGTVRDVVVVESNPPRAFDDAARRAVARWNCEPRMVNGAAVEQRVTQTIDFKLDGS